MENALRYQKKITKEAVFMKKKKKHPTTKRICIIKISSELL